MLTTHKLGTREHTLEITWSEFDFGDYQVDSACLNGYNGPTAQENYDYLMNLARTFEPPNPVGERLLRRFLDRH